MLTNTDRVKKAFSSRALASLLGVGALVGCGSSTEREAPAPEPPASSAAAPRDEHSVIVRFKPATGRASLRAIQASSLTKLGASFVDRDGDGVYDRFAAIDRSGRLMKLDLPKAMTVDRALAELRADPAIEYAEPNLIVRVTNLPDDPSFGALWGLNNIGQTAGTAGADIDAPEAWDVATGSLDIVVGVVDTGIDYEHEDLAANMWRNPGELAGNGVDDDGNGVIDDVHGYNAIEDSGDPMDDRGHGTHCAGTIGAAGDNGVGVTGVNWRVSLMALKFLDGDGMGTLEAAIAAIDYAVRKKQDGVNLRVLSNSWSGNSFSQALYDAVEAANAAGILFVAAAGNDAGRNNDRFPTYPASFDLPNIIAVAATDHHDGLATFSSVGPMSVDLGAPGVAVMSTVQDGGYQRKSGTSMAAPHVAGAAALLFSLDEDLTFSEVKELLLITGDALPALAGVTLSGRRLNVGNAVAAVGRATPGFNVGAGPAGLTVNQGATATYQIELSALGGLTGDVSLSVTSSPPINAAITFTPAVVALPGSATVAVATTAATAPGFYTLAITGAHGALRRSSVVGLRVHPYGTIEVEFPSTDTPLPIPDDDPAGVRSVIEVPQAIDISEVEVDLDITHAWVGDLRVVLRAPTGTEVTLHDRSGGGATRLHRTYVLVSELTGEQAHGAWTLHVFDETAEEEGALESWTLRVTGPPSAPTFTVAVDPGRVSVQQGASAQVGVDLSTLAGFDEAVTLSATAEPALAAQLSFSPATVVAPGASTLTIAPSCDATPGVYTVTIRGSGGGLLKEAQLQVTVFRFGSTRIERAGAETPLPIPRDQHAGSISSLVMVAESFPIEELAVEVHINHTFIGDVLVEIISPDGESVVLHNRTGGEGSGGGLHRTYRVPNYEGRSIEGVWTLRVRDLWFIGEGHLQSWTLHAAGPVAPPDPVASFTYAIDVNNVLRASFADTSTGSACGGAGIVGWSWDFGDGATSSSQHPSHTYATGGTYAVTLTVTDASGATRSIRRQVMVSSPLVLSIERVLRNRATFEFLVDLTWTGAQGALVELHRNGALVDIPNNDGAHRDQFRRYETSFVWKLCEQRNPNCSNEVSVVFSSSNLAANGEPTEATIAVKRADGSSTSRLVRIEDIPATTTSPSPGTTEGW
jgi:serine protease